MRGKSTPHRAGAEISSPSSRSHKPFIAKNKMDRSVHSRGAHPVKTLRVIDLFCGAGGASEALRRACAVLGFRLELVAVNHSERAIATHRVNHPTAVHLCQSIEHVDPKTPVFVDPVTGVTVKNTGRWDLLIAAPECTHFSTALGGRPMNDQSRSMAWCVPKWAQELYIDHILIENVPEFRSWGPIGADKRPLKSRKGETYRAFLAVLRSLGYKINDTVYNAADYGDPQTRQRLMVMATRGNRPLQPPMPTHSKHGGKTLFGQTKKWRSAREDIIDWSIEGKSVFTRKRPLSPKTWARIVAGLERFGGADIQPFLIKLRGGESSHINKSASSVDAPVPTLTASGTHLALVNAEPFMLPVTHGGGQDRVHDVNAPMPTVTGAHRGEIALVDTSIIVPNNHNNRAKEMDEPVPTVTGGGRLMKVDAFVLPQHGGGVLRPADQPVPTVATDGAHMLVEPFMIQPCHGGEDARRVKSVDEPLGTIPCSNRFAVIEPFLIPNYGERDGQAPRVHSLDEPVPTIPASGGGKFDVVEPFLVPYYTERVEEQHARSRSVDEPLPTVTASGSGKVGIVQPFLMSAGGPKVAPRSVDEPANAVLTRDHMALVDANFLTTCYGNGGIVPVSEPVPTITTKDRVALVMPVVNGRALDIRLRMLKPHELARAMSFGDGYIFTGNQGEQVKQIGNAWPCKLGEALITALLRDHKAERATAPKARKTA